MHGAVRVPLQTALASCWLGVTNSFAIAYTRFQVVNSTFLTSFPVGFDYD